MMNTTPNSNDDSIKALITQVTIQERHKADRTQYLLTLRNEDTKLNETLADISEKIESYNEELREIKIKIPEQVLKNQEAEEELTQQQNSRNSLLLTLQSMEEKKAAMVEALIQKEQEYKLLLEEATEICNANMASIEANLPLLLDMVKNSDK